MGLGLGLANPNPNPNPNPDQNYTSVDAFLEEQSAQRTHAAKAFEQIIDKLQALVEKVCQG